MDSFFLIAQLRTVWQHLNKLANVRFVRSWHSCPLEVRLLFLSLDIVPSHVHHGKQ